VTSKEGFSAIELMIVLAIIGLLAAGLVRYQHVKSMDKARASTCQYNRALIERAEENYALEKSRLSQSVTDLIDAGYLKTKPSCPSNGVYAWASSAHETIVCSVHSLIETELTSLGSTFAQITSGMTDLITAFFKKNGRYPRSFGEYVYTDIGLSQKEWAKSYDGLFYSPGGSRVAVRPDTGYTLTVMGQDGKQRVLTSGSKWSMWYDVPTGAWYFHAITPPEAVNISTLKVQKN
jgi:prepilin-type N-terminal cleavage/methylation domain-containing protein